MNLADLSDAASVAERLQPTDRRLAGRVADLAAGLADVLEAEGGADRGPVVAFFVPGRIEVLGKHTDYAGGRSITAAVDRGFVVVAVPRSDSRLRILDRSGASQVDLEIGGEDQDEIPAWGRYPLAVARRLRRDFGALRGVDMIFDSDLPSAVGMSSSSALVVAVTLPLAHHNELGQRPELRAEIASLEDLGGYLGAVENGLAFGTLAGGEGVGTFGGSEDQTAILCSVEGRLGRFSYAPVRFEGSAPLPAQWRFAVAVSGVRSSKAGGQRHLYNRISLLARSVAEVWRREAGSCASHLGEALAEAHIDEIRRVLLTAQGSPFSGNDLVRRLEHFVAESEDIVPAAWQALGRGDEQELGSLCERSQRLAEDWLGNQIPETAGLAAGAREAGALAASAFGGGFGGSVWALVHESEEAGFLERWRQGYESRFPALATEAGFLWCGVSAAARSLAGPSPILGQLR